MDRLPDWVIPTTPAQMARRLKQMAVALAVGGVLQAIIWIVQR